MIEFLNVVTVLLAGLVAGAALHSAYVHSKRRGELPDHSWDHDEEGDER